MRRRGVGVVAAILLTAVVLAGCGGDELTYDSRQDLASSDLSTTSTTAADPAYRHYIAAAPDLATPVTLYDEPGGPPSVRKVPNPNENGVIATFLVERRDVEADGIRWL
jgi:hypothetical protein